ncbi:multidrug resistance-associated protein 1-like [Mytilus trossulus]|uniref:multidrug resistance-associated protein 1-like n=1 Tax=Mytilus trossulus TaxID=6551 RepID=UPI00300512C4
MDFFYRIIIICYKQTITKTNLWNQEQDLKAEKNITELQSLWKSEELSFARRNFQHNVSYLKEYKSTKQPTNEETSLLHHDNILNDDEHLKKVPSLTSCLIKLYGFEWLRISLLYLVGSGATLLNPIILREIIQEVQNVDERRTWYSVLLAVLFYVVSQMNCFCFQHSEQMMLRLALKCLKSNNSSKKDFTAGEILSLVSVDCQRIQDSFAFSQSLLSIWLIVAIGIYELWEPLGISLFGCVVAVITAAVANVLFGKIRQNYFKDILNLKGRRVKLFDEIVKGIKIIKMYAWEVFYTEKVSSIRTKEIEIIIKLIKIAAGEGVNNNLSQFLMNFFMVLIYSFIATHPYDAERAFLALSVVNVVRGQLTLMPFVIGGVVQTVVSLGRIQSFLLSEEVDASNVQHELELDCAVYMKNGFFKWDKRSEHNTLKGINAQFEEKELIAVVGLVGSGKSSLISSILGEMENTKGKVQVKGSMTYITQEAWIQNMTIKENILFGKQYDEKKYNRIIDCCCLEPDLKSLPAGDLTEIGERGINLSGGQKQRVNVARAVYADADIYLLDDPLSAVDAHVGKDLFHNVIGPNGLLKNKTRILVTHAVHLLPHVDRIVVMDNGQISEEGTFDELVAHNGPFAQFLKQHLLSEELYDDDDEQIIQMNNELFDRLESTSDVITSDEEERQIREIIQRRSSMRRSSRLNSLTLERSKSLSSSLHQTTQLLGDQGKLIQDEESQVGSVKTSVFITFIKAMGISTIGAAFSMLFISSGLQVYSNFWITYWTRDSYLKNETLMQTDEYHNKQLYYLGMYGCFGGLQGLTWFLYGIFLFTGFANASSKLHQKMLRCIMHCPMSFFDTTPVGRIINRFSSDIDVIDERFRRYSDFFIGKLTSLLSIVIVIVIQTPLTLIAVVPVSVLFIVLIRFYLPTARQLKRIEAVTRSPIFNFFSETINGASVIRAYKSQNRFVDEIYKRLDINSGFNFAATTAMGWIGVRIQSFGNLVVFAAALFAVLSENLSGADVGLSLSYAMQIMMTMNAVMQVLSFLQMDLISIERIEEFTHLDPEAEWINAKRPPEYWPDTGRLQFVDYSTRYRSGLDLVLKGIFFDINGGEKIGIVGRTGAGKSSLTLSIFRLIEKSSGHIVIDGIKIDDIGLHDLRSQISILPQDPVIFSESLRENLDPKSEFSDEQIWKALECAHLKDYIANQDQCLEIELGESGGNLSVGQRQLLCLARTLLHKRKILILDEATAAVDMETDELIQQTIRTQFADCTVLSIAHRINTIMDYDRILVMDQGCIAQFDTPSALLKDKRGVFFSLAKEAELVNSST